MRYCGSCLALLGAFFCATIACGASLTWEDAAARAKLANPTLIKASQAIENAKLSLSRTYGAFLPSLSASAGVSQSLSFPLPSVAVLYYGTSAGVNGSLSLFNGFADIASVAQAADDLKVAQQSYRRTLSDVTYRLKRDYIALVLAQEQVALCKRIQEKRGENMQLIQLKYDAGLEDKGSLLQVQADKASSDFDVNSAERARALAVENLIRSIGIDAPEDFIAVSSFTIPSDITPVTLESAITVTPEYNIGALALHKAASLLTSARSGLYPSISLSGGINYSGDNWSSMSENGWNTGLSLSYPFFTGGQNFYNAAIGSVAYETAKQTFRETLQQLRATLAQGLDSYIDAVESVSVSEKSAASAQVQSDISTEKYLNGLVAYFEWYSVVNSNISAEKALLNSRFNALQQQAAWQNLLGEPAR